MNGSRKALRMVTEILQPAAGGADAAMCRRRQTDWALPLALANAHLVGPNLYVSLAEADALGDLPRDVRDYLALLWRNNSDRNAALRRQLLELISALSQANVRPLLLKGALAFFLNHYRDPGARMIRDLDVLVPTHSADSVFGVLNDLGYTAKMVYPSGHHAYADFTRPGDPGAVDLHFELVDASHVLPAREVWHRARAMREGNVEFLVPSPTHHILHHLLHAQIHYLGNFYRGVIELRQLHEFAALVRHYGEAIDWAYISSRMAPHRLDVALQSYTIAAERLCALPWPLPDRPNARARLHCGRCLAQFHVPFLGWLGVPWGNLRACFAWHRMRALYGSNRASVISVVHHALQYFHKKRGRAIVSRLFRVR